MRIRNTVTKEEFDGEGAVPAGYEVVGGPTTTPDDSFVGHAGRALLGQSASGKWLADKVLPPDPRTPGMFKSAADSLVPRDPALPHALTRIWEGLQAPSGAGAAIGAVAPPVMEMLPPTRPVGAALNNPTGRTLLSTILSAGGGLVEGKDPVATGAQTFAANVAGEGGGALGSKGFRSLPTMKGRINEGVARDLRGAMNDVNPVAGPAIDAAVPSAEMRGGRTTAQIRSAVSGGQMQDAASGRFDANLANVDRMAGNPMYNSPELRQAFQMMPALARDQMVGQVGPQGFTLQQAHAIRSWLGSNAFGQSPMGQGVGPVPQQRLWGTLSQQIEGQLPSGPPALQAWRTGNREYSGLQALMEALGQPQAYQGLNNRMMLNRNAISEYLAQNRQDLTRRLGPQGYDELVNRVMRGGEPGTRDLLTPGGGGIADAAHQTFGRGQGGSPQLIGAPLRTALPNVGSQYTGRQPYRIPPILQGILDVGAQRGVDEALR